jgi:hypothetical protein
VQSVPSAPTERRHNRRERLRLLYGPVACLILFGTFWVVGPLASAPSGWRGAGWSSQLQTVLAGAQMIHASVTMLFRTPAETSKWRRMAFTTVTVLAACALLITLAATGVWIGASAASELRDPMKWLRQVVVVAMVAFFGGLTMWLHVPARSD